MPARRAGRDRLATVRRDFFLDPAERLSEQERALMTAMLHALVTDLADELRAALPPESAAANDDDNSALIADLTAAGLLDDAELIELLLRRADEEQISSAVRARQVRRDSRFLQALVSDEDGSVSAAAMALILARGRRRDRFGQPRIDFDDVPRPAALRLVQSIAAALRPRLLGGAAAADRQLGEAIAALAGRHEPARSLDALTAELVRLIDRAGRLDDALLTVAADEGDLGVLAEALARRAGIDSAVAAELLFGSGGRELVLVLRIAGMAREPAARILAGPGELIGVSDPAREIARFDSLAAADIEARREWLRLDPHYRRALAALGSGHGQRAV